MSDVTEAIDKFWADSQTGSRAHLGASQIGEPCERKLVYLFRHAKEIKHDGRLLRLFRRGHLEEPHLIQHLLDIGFEIREYAQRLCFDEILETYSAHEWEEELDDEFTDVTHNPHHVAIAELTGVKLKQWSFKEFGGHFSGSSDGKARWPASKGACPFKDIQVDVWFKLEFKTSNTAQFVKLTAEPNNVKKLKPIHYAQMQQYMLKHSLPFTLYMVVNKNDDDLYTEIVPFDPEFAATLDPKALRVIMARQLPPRAGTGIPSWHDCRFCDLKAPCHYAEPLLKKCRTCQHVVPVDDARFHCGHWNTLIPLEVEDKGCNSWVTITD